MYLCSLTVCKTSLGKARMLWGWLVWLFSTISDLIASSCYLADSERWIFKLQSIRVSWSAGIDSTNCTLSEASNQSFTLSWCRSEWVTTFSCLYSGFLLDFSFSFYSCSLISRLYSLSATSFSKSNKSCSFYVKYFYLASSSFLSIASTFSFRAFFFFLSSGSSDWFSSIFTYSKW